MFDALHYLLDNIFIRFGSKLHFVCIPMGTNSAPLVADLFCFVMRETSCCLFLTIIKLMLSKYLDDLLNIDHPYFEHMVGQLSAIELQLNKAKSFDDEASFFWTCP